MRISFVATASICFFDFFNISAAAYVRESKQSTNGNPGDNDEDMLRRSLQSDSEVSYSPKQGKCLVNGQNQYEGSIGQDFDRYDSLSYQSCKNMCSNNDGCKAFEFSESSKVCEIWKNSPGGYQSYGDTYCYIKTPITYDECVQVHRRPLFGTGDTPFIITKTEGYKLLVRHYNPFGASVPDPADESVRKWRVYGVYYDEKSNTGKQVNLNTKFVLTDGSFNVFTLPTIGGTDIDWRGSGLSDWYESDKNDNHASIYVKVDTDDAYNIHGMIYWLELIAYDCYSS